MKKLEVLKMMDNEIEEIKGLDKLTNLKILCLGENKISEIKDLNHNCNLEVLSLRLLILIK